MYYQLTPQQLLNLDFNFQAAFKYKELNAAQRLAFQIYTALRRVEDTPKTLLLHRTQLQPKNLHSNNS